MNFIHDHDRQRRSAAFARDRDRLLLWLLDSHPATAGMLAGVGLFPSPKKANRRLLRLARRQKVALLGTVCLKIGRPEHVYGRARWMRKADTLVHEVQITRVCLKIDADEVRRGPGSVDGYIQPDAELLIAGRRFFLEFDQGTMSIADVVRKRFGKYTATKEFVLWVCPTQTRLETLRRHAASLRGTALFTTLERALACPHSAVWSDVNGAQAALPHGGNPYPPTGPQSEEKPGTFSPPASGRSAPYITEWMPHAPSGYPKTPKH